MDRRRAADRPQPDSSDTVGGLTDYGPDHLKLFTISFSVAGGVANGAGFRSTQVLSGNITNTAVPEPASVLLLVSGLAGMGLWGMNRRKRA